MARRSHIVGADPASAPVPVAGMACPLCGRPLGTVNVDRHHLVPKSLKGKEQFPIHKVCHRKIHATFSERELLRSYHTWEALRADADMRVFIDWVANKPAAFYTRTFTSNKKKGR